jgi:putative oxidoreductase
MATIGVARTGRFDTALALLRLVVGAVFTMHGTQKLFVFGLEGVSQGFGGMGVPMPAVTGPAVALLEFFGGLALIIGVLTRLAAIGLAIDMLGAMLLVHLPNGFFLPNGVEFALVLFTACVALAIAGAGEFSVDAALGRRRSMG